MLVRVATDSLWVDASSHDKRIATQHANIIVIAILITTTLGSALTTVLGPILLSQESRVGPEGKFLMNSNALAYLFTPNIFTTITARDTSFFEPGLELFRLDDMPISSLCVPSPFENIFTAHVSFSNRKFHWRATAF